MRRTGFGGFPSRVANHFVEVPEGILVQVVQVGTPKGYIPSESTYRLAYKSYKSITIAIYKMETVGYCMRIQALEGYSDKLSGMTYSNDYVGMVSVRHEGKTGENPHYHAVIRTGVKAQAFRVRMKVLFPDGKGNQHMSIVPWDGNDDALSYLFHEDPSAVLLTRKGLTDERILELRAKNNAVLELVGKSKQKASWTLENDAFEYFNATKPYYLTEKVVASYIYLIALRQEKYPPQPWLMRAMVTKVLFRMKHGDMAKEEQYCDRLAEMLYGDRT